MRPPSDPPAGPLDGLRVVDCSTVLAGPYATMLLADLGADVIKVEPPEGDATRGWGPPWVGAEDPETRTAAYFLAVNRNKRSLRLDLRQDDGRTVLRRLLADADVFVENFRAGALDRMGFGDEVLTELNGRLVHLAISGYGSAGPDASRPGYDFVIQAVSGLMSITGDSDAEGGHPTKVGVAIADVVAGLQGAVGVLAAVVARGTREPDDGVDVGQRVDVALLDSTLAILVNQAQNAFVSGGSPGRLGNAHPNIVPYETFGTADGEIAVAVGSERQWPRFCRALGLPALADEPRFATNEARVTNRDELVRTLRDRFATRASADWLADLEAADVPAGPINDVATAFETAATRGRPMTSQLEHPRYGFTRQVAPAIALSRTPTTVRTPPPLLGEHTDEILTELGYEAGEIRRLRASSAV
ncbi:MAG TPA: CaiB/BaiF CoA-transferase family protein [Candidatus Limnocylindrales bacterium]|nr:CaiB/BaiF CoA-transferase family protein [Candidatus Limnocylindrales bacterium]